MLKRVYVSIFCSALYITDTSQMAEYTLNELRDMHLLYRETRGNSCVARVLYAERFPMRTLPSHVLFQRIDARICETGHVGLTRRGAWRPRNVRRNMSQWSTANGNRQVSTFHVSCGTRMIVNANVLTLVIVASLRWHRDDPFNFLQTQQHKQN